MVNLHLAFMYMFALLSCCNSYIYTPRCIIFEHSHSRPHTYIHTCCHWLYSTRIMTVHPHSYLPCRYQAEVAQGRLESLFNFQTMVSELTGLPVSNASVLDEPTAAAEAMAMCHVAARQKKPDFLVDSNTHPQTIGLLRSRAGPLGINVCLFFLVMGITQ